MTFIGAIMTIGPVTGEHSQNKLAFRPIDQEVNQKDVVATGSVIDFFLKRRRGTTFKIPWMNCTTPKCNIAWKYDDEEFDKP